MRREVIGRLGERHVPYIYVSEAANQRVNLFRVPNLQPHLPITTDALNTAGQLHLQTQSLLMLRSSVFVSHEIRA
jgi:hypothetical protein